MSALTALRRSIPEIARICRRILLIPMILMLLCTLSLSPMLFGFRPFAVGVSDCADFPQGALAYYRYVPAEDVYTGMPVTVSDPDGLRICTVSGRDDAERLFTVSEGETIPFERIEGELLSVCVPLGGTIWHFFTLPTVLWTAAVLTGLLSLGGFVLPKLGYRPKYGKEE